MLQFLDVSEFVAEKIEVDDYIPLNIEWGESRPGSLYYWRTGNFKKSLLEIGITSGSQIILSITLTLADRVNSLSEGLTLSGLPSQAGIPMFQTKDWSAGSYVDELGDFEVLVGKNNLLLSLKPIDHVISTATSERVRFGLSRDHHLIAIEVFDLQNREISILEAALF